MAPRDPSSGTLCARLLLGRDSLKHAPPPLSQVIVFYHHPSARGVPVMWPGDKIPAPWANTTEPGKLIRVSAFKCLIVYSTNTILHLKSILVEDNISG